MARATDLASFRTTEQPFLAAWSVMCQRWPALADWLRDDPDRIAFIDPQAANGTSLSSADQTYLELSRSEEVSRLVSGTAAPGLVRIDAAAVRRVIGRV